MSTNADKTQEINGRSMADVLSRKKSSSKSAFQFEDNRPEAIAQRKLQEMANNSQQVNQLSTFQGLGGNSFIQLKTTAPRGMNIIQRVRGHLAGDVEEEFDSTDGQSASSYLDWLCDYSDVGLSADDVNHEFLKDVATRHAGGGYGTHSAIIGQRLEKLAKHRVILNLGDSLTPLPPKEESEEERMIREEREAEEIIARQREDEEERARIEWITRAHGALTDRFGSSENQRLLEIITANKDDYLVYRGEWYERSLHIMEMGTFGGVPPVKGGESLLKTDDPTFQSAKDLQKDRGGDEVKKIINEWTTDLSLAKTYGERFVMLVGLIDQPEEGHEHIIYPREGVEGEKGVLADSRYPLKAVAILSITPEPNFEKKVKGGS